MKPSRGLARREFLRRVALSGGALAIAGPLFSRFGSAFSDAIAGPKAALDASTAEASIAAASAPVVAFFDGSLWLDTSGTSTAYEAPLGARAAAPLADLSDHELLSIRPYI